MIRVDISRAIPPTAFSYLAALIPGLFFELSILLANPKLIARLVAQAEAAYPFGYFSLLVIALLAAFAIGNGSILFVRLIQKFLGLVYRLRAFCWKALLERKILPSLGRLMQKPGWINKRWFMEFYGFLGMRRSQISHHVNEVQRCWHIAAAALLENSYGIKRSRDTWSGMWYSVLGKSTAEHARGNLLMVATHAMGWCGIVAAHFAPALRERYYMSFLLLLILCGILHDWWLAKWQNDPILNGLQRTRAVLDEMQSEIKHKQTLAAGKDDAGNTLSIAQDDD